jgi:hypothetical protein
MAQAMVCRATERTEKARCCESNRSLFVCPLHRIFRYQSGAVR